MAVQSRNATIATATNDVTTTAIITAATIKMKRTITNNSAQQYDSNVGNKKKIQKRQRQLQQHASTSTCEYTCSNSCNEVNDDEYKYKNNKHTKSCNYNCNLVKASNSINDNDYDDDDREKLRRSRYGNCRNNKYYMNRRRICHCKGLLPSSLLSSRRMKFDVPTNTNIMQLIFLFFVLLLGINTTSTIMTNVVPAIQYVYGDDTNPVPTITPTSITQNDNNNNIPISIDVTTVNRTLYPTMGSNTNITPTSISNIIAINTGFYRQGFVLKPSLSSSNNSIGDEIFFNSTQEDIFTTIVERYTPAIIDQQLLVIQDSNTTVSNDDTNSTTTIQTNCTIDLQSGTINSQNRLITNTIDYRCQYIAFQDNDSNMNDSIITDTKNLLNELPFLFTTFMNNDLLQFTFDLQDGNLTTINTSLPVTIRIIQSPSPTISIAPTSFHPSMVPTKQVLPTTDPIFIIPSKTAEPSIPMVPILPLPLPVPVPVVPPQSSPMSNNGNEVDTTSSNSTLTVAGIVAIVITGGILCLFGLYLFYYRSSKRQQQQQQKLQFYNTQYRDHDQQQQHQQSQAPIDSIPSSDNHYNSYYNRRHHRHNADYNNSNTAIGSNRFVTNHGSMTNTSSSSSRRTFRPGGNRNVFRSNRRIVEPNGSATSNGPIMVPFNNSDMNPNHHDHNMMMLQQQQQHPDDPSNYIISPTDSHISNKSMLSTGDSVIAEGSGGDDDHQHHYHRNDHDDIDNDVDSNDIDNINHTSITNNSDELIAYHRDIEEDGTKNLQDEFDLYKDQNLEILRTDVEGNLSGFEGYMSAAVTNALMGDDEKKNYEMQELLWGCDSNPDGTEIEASALFEVTDWLTRNESAGMERKGAFMQEILNKMVTSVRFGVIIAEDASRTIHESAAILGLQLAEDLPVTTVIISGMRKTTRTIDMMNALNEFGDIDNAAVASGKRGFGIVRFRRRISVDHALQQYRAGEIVILDVSIQMKVLMPNGVLESR